jgi:hypothetical protein
MLRGFTDSTGVDWRVWEVYPSKNPDEGSAEALSRSSLKNTAFANGWLCFESPAEKRRLAPIPSGWEFHETQLLEQLRDEATIVPLRRQGRGASGAA